MPLAPSAGGPPLWNLARWMLSPAQSLLDTWKRAGDTYRVNLVIFGDEIVVTKPDTIRQVLTDDVTFAGGQANALLAALVGDRSILLLDGREHARDRKLMLPPFHGERMTAYTAVMRDAALAEMARWHTGETVTLLSAMQRIALDIILRCVLGLRDDEEKRVLARQISRVLDAVQSPTGTVWMYPPMQVSLGGITPWAHFCREREKLDKLLYEHIARHRVRMAKERNGDVLELLIDARDDAGAPLTDIELRDQLVTLLFAGHETSATTACWVVEEVLRCDGEQARLRDEVMEVTGGAQIEADHVPQLARLDSVVREALRLHPVTGVLARSATRDTTLDGYDVPASTYVVPCIFLTHRRPELYPEPDRFVPTRFLGKKPDPYAWLPFGGGSRRCLGVAFALWEIQVVLATILSRHRLTLTKPAPLRTTLRSFLYAPKGSTVVRVD